MASGAVRLVDYPGDLIDVACSKCERRARYRKVSLIAIHGSEIGLPDLRARMAADCPRQRNPLGTDRCGAHYPKLANVHDVSPGFS